MDGSDEKTAVREANLSVIEQESTSTELGVVEQETIEADATSTAAEDDAEFDLYADATTLQAPEDETSSAGEPLAKRLKTGAGPQLKVMTWNVLAEAYALKHHFAHCEPGMPPAALPAFDMPECR